MPECKMDDIPTKEDAERIKRSYEQEGCTNVVISGDGPFTVIGQCEED
jgi:hypothetical protein